MSRVAYVNGRYVPHGAATVHIEDRGYQFADGVYEVISIDEGRFIDEEAHLDRLDRSLNELAIAWPMSRRALKLAMRQVVKRNLVKDGLIYLQITRGVAPREHGFPKRPMMPSLVMTAKTLKPAPKDQPGDTGVTVVSMPDIRWSRPDIKSVALLPNVLCKEKAHAAGAFEAWLVDRDGFVTEGSSTNAWIVTKDNRVVTRDFDRCILNGITRLAFLKLMADNGLTVERRKFTIAEAQQAKEAFVTSSTARVKAVVSIDGQPVGNGHPGETVARLRGLYWDAVEQGGALPKTPTDIREKP